MKPACLPYNTKSIPMVSFFLFYLFPMIVEDQSARALTY
jgi:hypothetical protein